MWKLHMSNYDCLGNPGSFSVVRCERGFIKEIYATLIPDIYDHGSHNKYRTWAENIIHFLNNVSEEFIEKFTENLKNDFGKFKGVFIYGVK